MAVTLGTAIPVGPPPALTGSVHSWDVSTGVDGPGTRFVVFLAGCPLTCLYCHNPDTWRMSDGTRTGVDAVVAEAAGHAAFIHAAAWRRDPHRRRTAAPTRLLHRAVPPLQARTRAAHGTGHLRLPRRPGGRPAAGRRRPRPARHQVLGPRPPPAPHRATPGTHTGLRPCGWPTSARRCGSGSCSSQG